MVLYFSGTGNSKYAAELIAKNTGDELYSMNEGIKYDKYPNMTSQQRLIFVMPTYAWRMPKDANKWIASYGYFSDNPAYFVLTCGGGMGSAAKHAEKLCKESKLKFKGCAEIIMPENYIAMYDCPSEDESLRIVENADKQLETVISLIQGGNTIPEKSTSAMDSVMSDIINPLFYTFAVGSRKFYTYDKCISCGKCESLCPLNNIKIKNGRPKWGNNCTHCMACICGCPTEAIEYGKISTGKRRYHCPK